MIHDTLIVGGGPAGLSAALVLGRCRRSVLVVDARRPRNRVARAMHGFLTRDGVAPERLLELGRAQLAPYDVRVVFGELAAIERFRGGFEARLGRSVLRGRTLLLATGMADYEPAIPGLAGMYGVSVFHCPYCDGWEVRDRPVAVYGKAHAAVKLALSLKTWTDDLILFTDGPPGVGRRELDRLARHRIAVRTEPVERLEGRGGRLAAVRLEGGERVPRAALFFHEGHRQASPIALALGCPVNASGAVRTTRLKGATCPGVWVAGDAAMDIHLAILAAADGARAGFAINLALQREERA